jgi:hypothetical protein
MDTPSQSELYRMHQSLEKKIDDGILSIKDALDEIKSKQDYTNGRVTKLEKWQSFVYGALAVLAALNIPSEIINLLF